MAPVRAHLDAAGYKYEIKARVKVPTPSTTRWRPRKVPFEEIYDIYAVRVIFENDNDEKERVRITGKYILFSPTATRFTRTGCATGPAPRKPTATAHCTLTAMGPDGKWIEVQIRSRKMDVIAELGYTAHWKYKTGEHDDDTELDKWMNTIKDILANPEPNAIDFLDTIKLNLFSSEIYVFHPQRRPDHPADRRDRARFRL